MGMALPPTVSMPPLSTQSMQSNSCRRTSRPARSNSLHAYSTAVWFASEPVGLAPISLQSTFKCLSIFSRISMSFSSFITGFFRFWNKHSRRNGRGLDFPCDVFREALLPALLQYSPSIPADPAGNAARLHPPIRSRTGWDHRCR